jgi:hypothetical protein
MSLASRRWFIECGLELMHGGERSIVVGEPLVESGSLWSGEGVGLWHLDLPERP